MTENGQIVKKVNPSIIQYNERLSNQNEIETVFGQEFVEKRTASCEYHFENGVKKYLNLLPIEDQQS